MKKIKEIILSFLLLISFLGFSQSKIGVINDKDGFVNIRLKKSSKSQIIGKIIENEYFNFFEDNNSSWWTVESRTGLIGYVHKSRILFIKKGYYHRGSILNNNVDISFYEYFLNDVSIGIFQLKPQNGNHEFYCKALIRTTKTNNLIDEIYYNGIEPVGGSYGLTFSKKQNLSDLFIVSKFGDYNGEILIVDVNGKTSKYEGGQYFITNNREYLVSGWNSDASGLTIYDLKNKQIRLKKELKMYLEDWYYQNGIYYASTWDEEKELYQTFQIDFENFKLKKSMLKIDKGKIIELINKDCGCK